MKHFFTVVERKGCHGNDNETVPLQHSGSDNSLRMSVRKKVWREHAKDGGVIPVTGFPRVNDGMAMRRNR